ncbi:MAG: methyltransferase domain-containing protein [Pseudonocardiales bacterium]|nr:methyltransferase domain-containing protein [Pseudonocardiales bacterium]
MTSSRSTVKPPLEESARIHGIMTAYLQSKAVFVAVELGLFDTLEKGSRTIEALAAELGIERRPTRALLFALQGLHLVSRDGERYQNTDEASRFLVTGKPGYMGGFAEHQDRHFGNFTKLTQAMRENTSLTGRVLKGGYSNQGAATGEGRAGTDRLIQAMRVSSRLQADSLAAAVPLWGVSMLLDLGCGSGDYSVAIARKNPDIRIIAMDYPAVCELAGRNVAEAGVGDIVEVRANDILRDPWPECDAVMLSHVLDGYGSEQAAKLIEKVYNALPAGGRLLVHGHMPALATGVFPYLFGLILLGNTEDGEVRDVDDIRGWVRDAGFRDVETCTVSLLSGLLTAYK